MTSYKPLPISSLNHAQYLRKYFTNKCTKPAHHINIRITEDNMPIVGTPNIHFLTDDINELKGVIDIHRGSAVDYIEYNETIITKEDGDLWALILGISQQS